MSGIWLVVISFGELLITGFLTLVLHSLVIGGVSGGSQITVLMLS
jgi:hypothetical protein